MVGSKYISTERVFQNGMAATKKAQFLVDDFWASFGVASCSIKYWEMQVGWDGMERLPEGQVL